MGQLSISEVRFRMSDENEDGLVAWVSCVLNDSLYLNNMAIRRSRSGKHYIAYPAKKSLRDNKYFYFRPINSACKMALEDAILGAFRKVGDGI